MSTTVVYRLSKAADWEAAKASGEDYKGAQLDFDSGFVHLSTVSADSQGQACRCCQKSAAGALCIYTCRVLRECVAHYRAVVAEDIPVAGSAGTGDG